MVEAHEGVIGMGRSVLAAGRMERGGCAAGKALWGRGRVARVCDARRMQARVLRVCRGDARASTLAATRTSADSPAHVHVMTGAGELLRGVGGRGVQE